MDNNIITWEGILETAMKTPGIKVNRSEFLSNAFKTFGDVSTIVDQRPIDLFDETIIEKVAHDTINGQALKVTVISTLAGIPGGLAMFGTIPADMAQYYFHVLVLAQKLGYIYGWPDLSGEDGGISEGAKYILTIFVGVMMGTQVANKALGELAKRLSVQVAKRIPQMALTKTFFYPILKQICKWLGEKITKDTFGKALGKFIPFFGGVMSGGVTYATFRPMAYRLRDELRNEMKLFDANDVQDEMPSGISEALLEELSIKLCINVAKIDSEINDVEKEFLTDMIESSSLTKEKINLLKSGMTSPKLEDVNFSLYEINDIYAAMLVDNMLQTINIDGAMTPAEENYLNKIAQLLNIPDDELEEMILTSRGV